ncbi:MAG TPA: hypothetical protein VOA41_11835 [Candidatus Dormibacteraeota bacterium]|nr:hypothetical protein [Candidatus Dormibacteraeota bacterium]
MLGRSNVAIDDRWLPVEPFPHLMAATRWAEPTVWGQFAVRFLYELPLSLSNNTEVVVQFLPHLTSLSELRAVLTRYVPQLRVAFEACGYDDRILTSVAATLEHAYEFWKGHDNYLRETEARAAFFAAHGNPQRDYRAEHASLLRRAGVCGARRQRKRERFAGEADHDRPRSRCTSRWGF